jgi:hypothetical protein
MDLNKLLHNHQRALIERCEGGTVEARHWAGLSATFYAEQIARARGALGLEDPFTWSREHGGIVACG